MSFLDNPVGCFQILFLKFCAHPCKKKRIYQNSKFYSNISLHSPDLFIGTIKLLHLINLFEINSKHFNKNRTTKKKACHIPLNKNNDHKIKIWFDYNQRTYIQQNKERKKIANKLTHINHPSKHKIKQSIID